MMSPTYDIFRRDAGAEVWVEAAQDLETAKSRVIELSTEAPGQYVVFSQRNGRMVSSGTVLASPAARAASAKQTSDREASPKSSKDSETLW